MNIQQKNEERKASLIAYIDAGRHIDADGNIKSMVAISKEAMGSSMLVPRCWELVRVLYPEIAEKKTGKFIAKAKADRAKEAAEEALKIALENDRIEAERAEADSPVTQRQLKEALAGINRLPLIQIP